MLYLSFDDGPHPEITPWVMDELDKWNAKAAFFLIGECVERHPAIARDLLQKGHRIGNHSHTHPNGKKQSTQDYLADVTKGQAAIAKHSSHSPDIFRPPYGRLRPQQAKALQAEYEIVMMDVLAGDFDEKLSPQKCLDIVLKGSRPGSIICLHDSQQAWPRLRFILPRMLEHFSKQGYVFENLPS